MSSIKRFYTRWRIRLLQAEQRKLMGMMEERDTAACMPLDTPRGREYAELAVRYRDVVRRKDALYGVLRNA